MTLLIGVDAGGSQTRAIVSLAGGTETTRGLAGSGSPTTRGVRAATQSVENAVRDAMAQTPWNLPAAAMVVGAAGVGREPIRSEYEAALNARGLSARVRVTTDAEIALSAAFDDQPGIVLMAGTGSVAFARDEAGTLYRAGGYGPRAGDEGSAYAIARDAVATALKTLDGRDRRDGRRLRDVLLAATDLSAPMDLVAWINESERESIAAVAPAMIQLASAGEPIARDIIDHAVDALVMHVAALTPHLDAAPSLALGGGLLSPESPVREAVADMVSVNLPSVRVQDTTVDAPIGALRLAAHLFRSQGRD